jgi:hypothetical protein
MKRWLLFFILIFAPTQSWAVSGFTFHSSVEVGVGGSSTSITSAAIAVSTSDLIIAFCANDSGNSITSITNPSDTLTLLTEDASGSIRHATGYIIGAAANSSVAFTCNFAAASLANLLHVWVFTPTGTVSSPNDAFASNAQFGINVNTGLISTTGTDEVVLASVYYETPGTNSAEQINAVNAVGVMHTGAELSSWYTQPSATFTNGEGTAINVSTSRHTSTIVAFKMSAGGGPDVSKFRRRVQ